MVSEVFSTGKQTKDLTLKESKLLTRKNTSQIKTCKFIDLNDKKHIYFHHSHFKPFNEQFKRNMALHDIELNNKNNIIY